MWLSFVLILFIVSFNYAPVNSQCPPKESDMRMIIKYLEGKLESIKKTKPGTDTRDADFVVNKIVKDIVNGKKFSPCNKDFNWSEVSQDVKMVRGDCYKPADYSTTPVQQEFMACARKHFPALVLKYGSPAISACTCFGSTIAPAWESKYKKLANQYVEEFKTLKHRKK